MAKLSVFIGILCLICIIIPRETHAKRVKLYDFDKAEVIYHRKKICIMIRGEVNCVKADEAPGDPAKIAKMLSMYAEESGYSASDEKARNRFVPGEDEYSDQGVLKTEIPLGKRPVVDPGAKAQDDADDDASDEAPINSLETAGKMDDDDYADRYRMRKRRFYLRGK